MYGPTIKISTDKITITLRAFTKDDIAFLVPGFSSLAVQMYTNGLFAQVYENEVEWYEKTRKSPDIVSWALVPEGLNRPIGVTALHGIQSFDGGCVSGIIIWEKDWWGKGVASSAHLVRTLFAADFLNRSIIRSTVRTENPGSFKALKRVGYTIWGTEPRSVWKNGQWFDTHHLIWFHPDRIGLLFPEGLPENYKEGVDNAKKALTFGRSVITFI